MTHPTTPILTCNYCGPDCAIPFGLCHCGCKRRTGLAFKSNPRRGDIGGLPVKFVRGHARVQSRPDTDAMPPFEFMETTCRLVALTKGQFATVEASRYEEFSQYFYQAKFRFRGSGGYYAARHATGEGTEEATFYMHREVMGVGPDDPAEVDHVDPKLTLVNIPKNLRLATPGQQRANVGMRSDNSSGFKGVCWNKRRNRWLAQIRAFGVYHFLGYFATREEAAEAYRKAAVFYFGEFANFG